MITLILLGIATAIIAATNPTGDPSILDDIMVLEDETYPEPMRELFHPRVIDRAKGPIQ